MPYTNTRGQIPAHWAQRPRSNETVGAVRPRSASPLARTRTFLSPLLAATALSMPMPVLAQSVWTGSVDEDWFDPANWSAGEPGAAIDAQINDAGTAPVIDGGDAITRNLTLGVVGGTTGSLTIENGGTLGSDSSSIGFNANTDYAVTVTGANSSWQSIGQFTGIVVGNSGRGQLDILNGADVVSNTSYIGGAGGSEGYVLVDGIGSTWTLTPSSTEALRVGLSGHGELVISGGGAVTSGSGQIGASDSSTGIATVSGAGSQWSMTSGLTVGDNGDGRLSVLGGGAVTSATAVIGGNSGSEGAVLVSGANSIWTVDGLFDIASFGDPSAYTTGRLTIAEGGTVNVAGGSGAVRVALVDGYTSGVITIGAETGDPAAAPGTLNAALIQLNQGGELIFNHTGTAYDFSADIEGNFDAAVTHLAGTTNYTGDGSNFIGTVSVSGGTLLVNGTLGHPVSEVQVSGGATLGGGGTFLGNVSVAGGVLAPGNSPGTLTIGGDLILSTASVLDFELGSPVGTPGVDSDLINVADNLTLDGTLNVIDAGGFGNGTYRLFNYDTDGFGGVLTDNGLVIGSVPAGFAASDLTVLTNTVGQVDLLVGGSPASFAFWDGSDASADGVIDGGNGMWTATATNWTNSAGGINGAYDPATFLIFQGTGGTVTVDNSAGAVTIANGAQFAVSGYSVIGGDITLSGAATIRVGDGTSASSGDVAVIGANLVGTGSLEKNDFGILTLQGTNAYTGGTTVTGGTLFGSAASLQGDILNSAELVFGQQTADGTYAGALTGGGATRKTGDYALTLSGNSSAYAGTTGVLGGTLLVEGELGGTLSVWSGATLGGNGTVGTVSVSDGGTLAPGTSPGTLTVSGDLVLSAASVLDFEFGSPAGTPGADSDLVEVGGDLTLDGVLNAIDAGGFGDGTYRLINYGGTLTDNGLDIGTVPAGFTASQLGVLTSTAGQVDLLVGGLPAAFTFWDGSNTAANNAVDGGSGTWTTAATNWTDSTGGANGAYDPSTFLIFQGAGGTVTVDNSAGAVTIANGAQFAVDGYSVRGGDITLSGANTIRVGDGTSASEDYVAVVDANLVGSGSLAKDDFGTLTLGGANSYTGGTTVSGGTLIGDTDSLQGGILNNAELVFRQDAADGIYAGSLTGAGAMAKQGDFGLTLTGNSSAYVGTTDVLAGVLMLQGELGGTLAVANGARLGGNGTAGAVTVSSGGTLAPGSSIGTLNVASATFDAGSIFEVELNDGGTIAGMNNDLVAASGAVTIDGGTVHVTPENGTDNGTTYDFDSQYTIVTAGGGVTGTFASLTDDYAYLDFALSYDAQNVFLTSHLTKTTFCLPGMTANQCATGEGSFSVGPGALFSALLNLSDSEAPVALDALSGEIQASTQAALVEDSRFPREAVLDRLGNAAGPAGSGLAVWGHTFGSWGKFDGDGNAAGVDRDIEGFFLGGDALASDNLRFGVFGGYGSSRFEARRRGSAGSADTWHLGAYAGGELGKLTLRVGGAYASHDIEIDRSAAFTGFSGSFSSSRDAWTGQVFGEAGYRFDHGAASFEPFANVAYVHLKIDDYAEAGDAAALAGGERSMDTTFTTVGLRAETKAAGAWLSYKAGWRHAFGDAMPRTTHAFAGGDAFTVAGVPIAKDAFVLDLGAAVDLAPGAMLGVSYSGRFASRFIDQGLKASVAVRF